MEAGEAVNLVCKSGVHPAGFDSRDRHSSTETHLMCLHPNPDTEENPAEEPRGPVVAGWVLIDKRPDGETWISADGEIWLWAVRGSNADG